MVQGMLSLLKNCPQEVAQLRRELLIAARHILSTDLRNRSAGLCKSIDVLTLICILTILVL